MTHTYNISGMTCNGCKALVEKSISSLKDVKDVLVNLDLEEATINTKTHIQLKEFQNVLSENFKISEKTKSHVLAIKEVKKESDLKQLFPLFLILGYILITSVLLNKSPFNLEGFMLDFMGLFFIVFSFFKLLDLKGFSLSFKMYDPLAKVIPVYALIYPFFEVALGLLFLLRFQIPVALVLSLIVLGITTIGVTKILLNKRTIQCACLGTALKLPMTKATFIENAIMIVMALAMQAKTISL